MKQSDARWALEIARGEAWMFQLEKIRWWSPRMVGVHLRAALIFGSLLSVGMACFPAAASGGHDAAKTSGTAPFPPQVELRVPFAPTAFPAEGGEHLLYELYVTNFGDHAITLDRVEALAADDTEGTVLARFSGRPLNDIAMNPGAGMDMSDTVKPVHIVSGETLALFMAVTVPEGKPTPASLEHRLTLRDGQVQGAVIGTRHNIVKTLAAPVEGAN